MGQLAEAISRRPEGSLPSQASDEPEGQGTNDGRPVTLLSHNNRPNLLWPLGADVSITSRAERVERGLMSQRPVFHLLRLSHHRASPSSSSCGITFTIFIIHLSSGARIRVSLLTKRRNPQMYIPKPPYPKALESPVI